MKEVLKLLSLFLILLIVYLYKDNISLFITDNILYSSSNDIITYNEYYLANNYQYVQNTDSNQVNNYQEMLNIIYTIINSGDEKFSFYCNYDKCIDDITNISNSNYIVSNINNFVHPYNSFKSINININSKGKITIKVNRSYSKEQIIFINTYINTFIANNVNISMSDYNKIKIFHDHIINNTIYDEYNTFDTYTAYNLLTSSLSTCGGYSDILAIYLNILGIKNYRITSENHIWNLVELNGKWYHIDATWDDPVASDGKQYLIHNFFMISTSKLHSLDKVEHNFDKKIYKEAK